MREIKVPRVPVRAFDKNRKPSDLIRQQVAHLAHVAGRHATGAALAADARKVRTESQAAAFIGRVTALLHREDDGAPPRTAAAPATTPGKPARTGARTPAATKTAKKVAARRSGAAKPKTRTRTR